MPGKTPLELHPELSDRQKAALFVRGCELFNERRFFDAHEPWEEIWRSTNPEPRDVFQGLVQIAAGMHIWLDRATAPAARRVMARGATRLARAGSPSTLGGKELDLSDLLCAVRAWQSWLEHCDGAPPELPRLVLREVAD